MKKMALIFLFTAICQPVYASNADLDKYIAAYGYTNRKEMKIDSEGVVDLLKEGKAQLVDIRFSEEYSAWKVMPSINIPLNELPARLSEIDKTKITVTACPHKDRAIIAMVYLRSKGIAAKYLTDGLLGLTEELRGDNAKEFIEEIEKAK